LETFYQELTTKIGEIDTGSLKMLHHDLKMSYKVGGENHFTFIKAYVNHIQNINNKEKKKKPYDIDIGAEIEMELLEYRYQFISKLIHFGNRNVKAINKIISILHDESILNTPEFRYEFIMMQHGIQMFVRSLEKILQTNKSGWMRKLLMSNKKDQYIHQGYRHFMEKKDEDSAKKIEDAMNSFSSEILEDKKSQLKCHLIFQKAEMLTLPKYEYEAILNLVGFTIYGYGALLKELKTN